MNLRDFIAHARLKEIYDGFQPLPSVDTQGWNSRHPVFRKEMEALRPTAIIEVGTWKGASAIHMARLARILRLDAAILCVDTWLGGDRAYVEHSYIDDTLPRGGRLRLLDIFMTNVLSAGLQNVIYPMPSTSADAAESLRFMGVTADLIYVDAAHTEPEVAADLENYWPVLRPGGVMIGDDYVAENWPGVVMAADAFAARHGLSLEEANGKFVVRKPAPDT